MTQRTAGFRLVICDCKVSNFTVRRYSSTMPPAACPLYIAPCPRRA
jgi:hypothetical protein